MSKTLKRIRSRLEFVTNERDNYKVRSSATERRPSLYLHLLPLIVRLTLTIPSAGVFREV